MAIKTNGESDILRYEGRTDKNEKYNNEINSRKDSFYPFFLSQCQQTNPNSNLKPTSFPTHQMRGSLPAQNCQIDFTHMPQFGESYLLVLVDTFSGWVEAFPWRRQWHPIPVIFPGKSHGRRSLEGCSPWGR